MAVTLWLIADLSDLMADDGERRRIVHQVAVCTCVATRAGDIGPPVRAGGPRRTQVTGTVERVQFARVRVAIGGFGITACAYARILLLSGELPIARFSVSLTLAWLAFVAISSTIFIIADTSPLQIRSGSDYLRLGLSVE